jgi:hypothetical protein
MIILLNHPLHPTRRSNSILSFPIYIYIYISCPKEILDLKTNFFILEA